MDRRDRRTLPVTHPAMLSREVVEDHGEYVEIREVWDLNNKDCPLVVRPRSTAVQYTRINKEELDFDRT
jgi:hypothetical protein